MDLIKLRTFDQHSPDLARAASSTEGDRADLGSARALAMTAIDVITDCGLVERIMADFREGHLA